MGVLEATVPLSPKSTPHPFARCRSRTIAAIIISVLIGTLGACGSSDKLEAANAWSLTKPEASAGGVTLSLEDGARWTSEGLTLDGTNFATTQDPGPLATDSSFTVSAWVRPAGQPEQYATVLSQSGDVAGAFFLGVAEGFWSLSVKPADGNGDDFVTNRDRATKVEVEPDIWVHLAGVYDSAGGRALFYLNGYPTSANGVATDPLFPAKGPMLFGSGQANRQLSGFFKGTVADVRTWPRALSAEEVTAASLSATPDGATLTRPALSAEFVCPDSHGGVCLGALNKGSYSTTSFEPTLSYTVQEGWNNGEDLPGHVLFTHISDSPDGAWGGSYIGVYQNVQASSLCSEEAQPGVGTSAAELAAWYRTVPGLEIVADSPAMVGGLPGIMLDFRVSDNWKSPCPLGGVIDAIPIIIGGGVSDLHHVMGAPLEMRLFLLDWKGGNVAIEITAVLEQHSLTDYLEKIGASAVVKTFTFEP
ncbi:LamG domain-containing protein [Arthrobacter sp. TWP1-1]|uniref:LamG domain-containing protein n=1 Tax=Arthrobacter sp. TWP1-1 TaxID=2804568 RepID=UPI003CE6BD66